jgi:hypothetical protein
MSRKTNTADEALREVFRSPEYLDALKARLLNGTAKQSEIALARSLGVIVDDQSAAREALRKMDRATLRVLLEMCRMAATDANVELQVIEGGDYIGVGYSVTTRKANDAALRRSLKPTTSPEPDPETEDLPDLMPQKPKA